MSSTTRDARKFEKKITTYYPIAFLFTLVFLHIFNFIAITVYISATSIMSLLCFHKHTIYGIDNPHVMTEDPKMVFNKSLRC